MSEENYLSFLDGELELWCNIEYCEEKIASAVIKKANETLTVTFISPSPLEGTALTITPHGSVMQREGSVLPPTAVPKLWLALGELFTKNKQIVAITHNNGITEIHTEGESGFFDYRTDRAGNLISIAFDTLRLTVEEGR